MTSRDFCYWLQGYLEIVSAGGDSPELPTIGQVECIRNHLAMVFVHEIDPSFGDAKKQADMNKIHQQSHGPVVMRC